MNPGKVQRRFAACLLLLLLLLGSESAFAHGAFKGIGNFYGGVLHPVSVPPHLLALVAAGLFAGRHGWGQVVKVLPLFMAACAAGLMLSNSSFEASARIALLVGAAGLGLLIAADAMPPEGIAALQVLAVGFIIALDSAPDSPTRSARAAALAGTGIGLSAAFVWLSGSASCLERPWQRIGIRVAGSWITACALLVLALAVSGKSPVGT